MGDVSPCWLTPRWLATFSASVGVVLVASTSDLWRERLIAHFSLPLVMPRLVYLAFGVYGGAAMRQRKSGDDDEAA